MNGREAPDYPTNADICAQVEATRRRDVDAWLARKADDCGGELP